MVLMLSTSKVVLKSTDINLILIFLIFDCIAILLGLIITIVRLIAYVMVKKL
jgi:hypothetical protein